MLFGGGEEKKQSKTNDSNIMDDMTGETYTANDDAAIIMDDAIIVEDEAVVEAKPDSKTPKGTSKSGKVGKFAVKKNSVAKED